MERGNGNPGAGRRLGAGLPLLLLILGACGALAWFLRLSDDDAAGGASARKPPIDPASVGVVKTVDARQLAAFAVLRGPAEGLPADLRRVLRHPVFGENFALARRLPLPLHHRFWVVPGRDSICLVSRGTSKIEAAQTTCTGTDQALRQGLTSVSLDQPLRSHAPAPRLIVGMAPDGTGRVVIRTGKAKTIGRVANGVFVVRDRATDPPDELIFR